MTTMPSPLSRQFWFADVDARPLALFRIGLGLLLLRDWLEWFPHLESLFSGEGIFPHGGPMPDYRWSLFSLSSSAAGTTALWGVGALALLGFTAGLLTRTSTVLAWALVVSLHNRNMLLLTGGDRLVEVLLLTSLFTRLGATWSVDARLWPRAPLAPALGLRFMQVEVALLYLMTARLKLRGQLWRSGLGIWVSLQHEGFLRPPGALLLAYPSLCRALNFAVLAMEGAFAFLAFSPVARRRTVPLAIACALGVQLGILCTMRVGTFTWVMLWSNVLWLEPAWLDALIRRAPRAAPPPTPVRTTQWVAGGLLCAMIALIAWDFLIGSRVPMPTPLRAVHRAASLEQLFELFGVTYDVSRWEAIGTRPDGATVDVVRQAAPGLRPEPGWAYDPWYKLTFSEELLDREALAQWLCRRSAQVSGAPLQSLELLRRSHPPSRFAEPPEPDTTTQLWSGPCRG